MAATENIVLRDLQAIQQLLADGVSLEKAIYNIIGNIVHPADKAVPNHPQDALHPQVAAINGNELVLTFRNAPRLVPVPKEDSLPPASSKAAGASPLTQAIVKAKGAVQFEFAEHGRIGDSVYLYDVDGTGYLARTRPIILPNGLKVTYGQINGLAGDFYGTQNPISDGANLDEQIQRFKDAFFWLAGDVTRNPAEAQKILSVLQQEVDTVNDYIQKGLNPSQAYGDGAIPDQTAAFEAITVTRPVTVPGYLGLARINWDHFGDDARRAYNAGHNAAIQTARRGNLPLAYAMNAFADHFLEDSFAAGHLRTPRRQLHSTVDLTADLCAKYMHDEDNAIGLSVTSPNGTKWTAYGDKRAYDNVDSTNATLCRTAIQTSINEVFQAWSTRKIPDMYGAWDYAPTLASARSSTQPLAPLFASTTDPKVVARRTNITDRRTYTFTEDYWFWSTAAEISSSGRWNYPIVFP